MSDFKPWYASRTIWASLATVIAAGGGLIGLPIEAGDDAAFTDTALQLVAAIGGIVALYGRISARSRIG